MIKWIILFIIINVIVGNIYASLFLLLIGVVIWIILSTMFSVKLRLQTVNFYSGGLGSGKTLTAVTTAVNLYRRSKLFSFLSFGLVKKREVYSNFPIILEFKRKKKEVVYSNILTKNHILGVDRLPEKVIVVLDETSTIFPNQPRKSDVDLTTAIRWFRHWTDGTMIMCDQSIGDIDITIRRRINVVYNLSSMRRYWFLRWWCYKIDVNRINYMEDVITNISDVDRFKVNNIFRWFGRKKRYESRYMRKSYNPLTENITSWDDLYIDNDEKKEPKKIIHKRVKEGVGGLGSHP